MSVIHCTVRSIGGDDCGGGGGLAGIVLLVDRANVRQKKMIGSRFWNTEFMLTVMLILRRGKEVFAIAVSCNVCVLNQRGQ